jgi:ribulose-bisphosphate carboxylase large chain
MAPENLIHATYRLRCSAQEAPRLARFIAYEQTVELPETLVVDAHLIEDVVGVVQSIEPAGEGAFDAHIAFNAELASAQLGQLINLVYGNVSMYPGIALQALRLPASLLARFAGPRLGVQGLRELLGVHDRPLLATAIKPRGLPIESLAQLAHDFARGGGDIVKDDQNLVSEDFDAFRVRVRACRDAVARANDASGGTTLYFPHLAARHEDLPHYAEFIRGIGLRGVLLCPSILGHDHARELAARFELVYMAHPAMTGGLTQAGDNGFSFGLALGTLLRLAGADISVFVAPGGRFRFSQQQAMHLVQACREPLGGLAPMWPCPAGGMRLDLLPDLVTRYGNDAVFLVGGALQGQDRDMVRATRTYVDEIGRLAGEAVSRRAPPSP